MDHGLRRGRLAARLPEFGVDALLVTRLPNVRYLTGFSGSSGQVVVAADGCVFLTDGRYTEQAGREVPDLERITYLDGFPQAFERLAVELGRPRLGFEPAGLTVKAWRELGERAPHVELVPVPPEIDRMRWAKDDEERAVLRRAQEATDAAFEGILGVLREDVTEREIGFELELAMRRAGADRAAFDPVVAFGENSAEPHHEPSDRTLRRGDVVKMDFGGLVDGYHADMTRTVAFGEPPQELRVIHEVVLRAQLAGVAALRPGATSEAVDGAARDIVEAAGYGERFTHGLGHSVGLEIHESLQLHRGCGDVVPAGAVVTIEPGVYVPGLGGVRIEDMIEADEGGGRAYPRSSKELIVV